jgi:hypothetical protein
MGSFLNFGPIIEKYGAEPGVYEPGDCSFEFIEDYTVYSAGFWTTVLSGGLAEIRLLLNEGSGNTFLYWGRIMPEFEGGPVYQAPRRLRFWYPTLDGWKWSGP